MLAFWGNNKALTARKSANCMIVLKWLRYSNRAVSNSITTVTEAYSNTAVTSKTKYFDTAIK